MDPLLEKNFISSKDASKISGYSSDYLSRLTRSGKIKGSQIGRTWLVDKQSLFAFLEQQGKHKEELARNLARERAIEYREKANRSLQPQKVSLADVGNAVVNPRTLVSTPRKIAPILRPIPMRVSAPMLRQTFALAVTVIILGSSAYASESDFLREATASLGSLALETAYGFDHIKSDFRIAANERVARVTEVAEMNSRTLAASIGRGTEEHLAISIADHFVIAPVDTTAAESALASHGIASAQIASLPASDSVDLGEMALSFGVSIRDAARAMPKEFLEADLAFAEALVTTSNAIMRGYEKGVMTWVEKSPEVAEGTAVAIFSTGEIGASIAAAAPTFATDAYDRAILAFVDGSHAVASTIVDAQIALGTNIYKASEASARLAIAPFQQAGEPIYEAAMFPTEAAETVAGVADSVTDSALGFAGQTAIFADEAKDSLAAAASSGDNALATAVASGDPIYDAGQEAAVLTYRTIRNLLNFGAYTLAFLLDPYPPMAIAPEVIERIVVREVEPAVTYSQPTVTNVTNQTVVDGVSESYVREYVKTALQSWKSPIIRSIHESTANLPDHIEVDELTIREEGEIVDLTTSTTTVNAYLWVRGDALFDGALNATNGITSGSAITAPYFEATSTAVASTFPYASTTMITAELASTTDLNVSGMTTFQSLTPSRLLALDGTGVLAAVGSLTSWIAGTTNQVIVTDDTDGTVTLALPQDIHNGATPDFAGLAVGQTGTTTIAADGALTTPSLTVSSLTSGRIPYATTSGLLTDSGVFTYDPVQGRISVPLASTTAISALNSFSVGQTATTTIQGDGNASTIYGPLSLRGITGQGSSLVLQRGINTGENSLEFKDELGATMARIFTNTTAAVLNVTADLVPTTNNTYDLGSPGRYWADAYVNNMNVNTLAAANTTISGTQSSTFTINSDNATNDTEDQSLVFFRGLASPNAVFSWNSTDERFELNQNTYIDGDLEVTGDISGNVTLDGFTQGSVAFAGPGGTLAQDNANFFWDDATNRLGIGTTTPFSTLSVSTTSQGNGLLPLFTVASTTHASLLSVLGNGNVGIGVASPQYELHIKDNVSGAAYLKLEGVSNSYAGGLLFRQLNNTGTDIFYDGGQDYFAIQRLVSGTPQQTDFVVNNNAALGPIGGVWVGTTSAPARFSVWGQGTGTNPLFSLVNSASTTLMQVLDNGNVGIGTTTPQTTLSVIGNATNEQLTLGRAGSFVGISKLYANSVMALGIFNNAGTEVFDISQGGNVSIGTTASGSRLDIKGVEATTSTTFEAIARFLNGSNAVFGQFYRDYNGSSEYLGLEATTGKPIVLQEWGGNVGIGTTSPYAKLAVGGDVVIGAPTAGGTLGDLYLPKLGTAAGTYLAVDAVGKVIATSTPSPPGTTGQVAYFSGTNTAVGTSTIFIATSGNVGIGTTTPQSKLSVVSGTNGTLNFPSGNWAAQVFNQNDAATSGGLVVGNRWLADTSTVLDVGSLYGTGSAWKSFLTVKGGGSVGIGTTSPAAALTVQGGTGTGVINIGQVGGNSAFSGISFSPNASSQVALASYSLLGGDGNTYINSPTGGGIYFRRNNADQMVINSGGLVGIGTSTPNAVLDLVQSSGSDTPGSSLIFSMGTGNQKFGFRYNAAYDTLSLDKLFGTWSPVMSWNRSSGNVGIGTTSPFRTFSVEGSGSAATVLVKNTSTTQFEGAGLVLQGPAAGGNQSATRLSQSNLNAGGTQGYFSIENQNQSGSYVKSLAMYNYNTDAWSFSTAGTERLRIDSSGNVGVGTTSPQSKLHVGSGSIALDIGASNGLFQTAQTQHANLNVGSIGLGINDGGGTTGVFVNNKDDGTYNSQYITFSTAQGGVSATTERLRITETGNVGIGTTTPQSRLSVSSASGINYITSDSIAASEAGFAISKAGAPKWYMYTPTSSDDLRFYAGVGGDRMALTSAGNLGIGSTTPSSKLVVYNGASGAAADATYANDMVIEDDDHVGLSLLSPNASYGSIHFKSPGGPNAWLESRQSTGEFNIIAGKSGGTMNFMTNNGSVGTRFSLASNGNATFTGTLGSGSITSSGTITAASTVTGGGMNSTSGYSTSAGGFYSIGAHPTTPVIQLYDHTPTGPSEIAYLRNSGYNTYIGLYGDGSTYWGANLFTAYVTQGNHGTTCSFGAGAWSCTSDGRLKEEITELAVTDGLSAINQLRPVTYALKKDPNHRTQLGFLAQEVMEIFPQAVSFNPAATSTDTPDGTYQLEHSQLIGPAILAIQQLDARTRFISSSAISTSSAPSFNVSALGNVGVGTTTDAYKFAVGGDVAATGFINVSTETSKIGINYLNASTTEEILADIGSVQIAQYKYKTEAKKNPLRLGLIAENAPALVLSADGKGVDIYKLATFTLAGVQALAAKVDAQTARLNSLEERLKMLEDGSIATGTFAFSTTTLKSALADLGVFLENGILRLNTLVARQFVAVADEDGEGSAGQGIILEGNKVFEVENKYVRETSKIFVTFTSPVEGSWYITNKEEGSFRIALSKNQDEDVSFDYFIVQTEGDFDTSVSDEAPEEETEEDEETDNAQEEEGEPAEEEISDDAPVVTLNGSAAVMVEQGGDYNDEGASAADPQDGDLTGQIEIRGSVDTNVPGLYTLTYSATDSEGNTGNASRVITVKAAGEPEEGGEAGEAEEAEDEELAPAETPDAFLPSDEEAPEASPSEETTGTDESVATE